MRHHPEPEVHSATRRIRAARPATALAAAAALVGCLVSPLGGGGTPIAAAAGGLSLGPSASVPAVTVPRELGTVIAGTGNRFIIGGDNDHVQGLYTADFGKTWKNVPADFGGGQGIDEYTKGYGGTFVQLEAQPNHKLRILRWDPDAGTVTTYPPELVDPFDDESEGLVVSDYVGSTLVLNDGRVFTLANGQATELKPAYAGPKVTGRNYALTANGATVVHEGFTDDDSTYLAIAPTNGGPGATTVKINGLLSMDVSALTIHYLVGTKTTLKSCRALAAIPTKASCTTVARGDNRPSRLFEHTLTTSAGVEQIVAGRATNRNWIVQGAKVTRVPSTWRWLPFRDTAKPMAMAWSKADHLTRAATVSSRGKVKPLLTEPRVPAQALDIALSAGRVTYLQDHYTRATGIVRGVWTRTRAADGTFGPELKLTGKVTYGLFASAARTAVQWDRAANGNKHTVVFYDGTTRTGSFAAASRAWLQTISGPYAQVRSQVVGVDGHAYKTGPVMALFGSLIVEASSATPSAARTYRVRDLARTSAAAVAVNLPQPGGRVYDITLGGSTSPWQMWGEWIVAHYTEANGAYGQLAFNYRTQQLVDLTGQGWIWGLGDGWIGMSNSDSTKASIRVLGGEELSLPVGKFGSVRTDGIRTVSWDALTDKLVDAPDPIADVTGLPTSAPRLLGAVGAARFANAGSHKWRPKFDLSKSVAAGSLELRNASGTLVRSLSTSASRTGSLRAISWNGRDNSGKRVPAGSYSWTLNVAASDGSGTATSVDGLRAATGTVRVTR